MVKRQQQESSHQNYPCWTWNNDIVLVRKLWENWVIPTVTNWGYALTQVVAKIKTLPWLDKRYGPSAVFLAGVSNFDSLKQNTRHKHTLAPENRFY